MKIKNFKMFLAGIIAFAVIFTFRECQDYKLRQDQKRGEAKFKIEKVEFDDVFIPVEKTEEINSESKISYNKRR